MALGPRSALCLSSASRAKHHAGSGSLSSNVRQHTGAMKALAIASGAAAAAEYQLPIRPRLVLTRSRQGGIAQVERPGRPRSRVHSVALRRCMQSVRTADQVSQTVGPPGGGSSCPRSAFVVSAWRPSPAPVRHAGAFVPSIHTQGRRHLGPHYRAGQAAQCCPTLRSSGTSTGMAPWPRAPAVYHRPRGQGTTPAPAPQLKRWGSHSYDR